MKLSVYTPTKVVFEGEIESFTAFTQKGKIGILKNRLPMIADLTSNILEFYTKDQEKKQFLIWGGLFRFVNNAAVFLVNQAESKEEINLNRSYEAKQKAFELIKESQEGSTNIDVFRAKKSLERAKLRIKFARNKTN